MNWPRRDAFTRTGSAAWARAARKGAMLSLAIISGACWSQSECIGMCESPELILVAYAELADDPSQHEWDLVATTGSGSTFNVRMSCGNSVDGERLEVPNGTGTVSVHCNDSILRVFDIEMTRVEGTVTYAGLTQAFAVDPEYYRPDANYCNPSQCREFIFEIKLPGPEGDAGPPPDGGSETARVHGTTRGME